MWQQHLIGKLVQLLYYALHTITIFNVLLGHPLTDVDLLYAPLLFE